MHNLSFLISAYGLKKQDDFKSNSFIPTELSWF